MTLRINSTAPNFKATTTQGDIDFHEWLGDQWGILFSHPKAFTPVCTTELGFMAAIEDEFAKRGCKIAGLSVDAASENIGWFGDIEKVSNQKVAYPIIADEDLSISKLYDMLPEEEAPGAGRTPANNATVRAVFIIDPTKKIRLILIYPMTCGRNFNEVLRALDALQLADKETIATPANWRPGDKVIVPVAVSDEAAAAKYPQGVEHKTKYLRLVNL